MHTTRVSSSRADLPQEQLDPLDSKVIRREVARTQRIVEGQNVDIRRTTALYNNMIKMQRHYLQEWRDEILDESIEILLPAERCPERHAALSASLGCERAKEIGRPIMLRIIDRSWSDHLADVAEIRRSIYLVRLGGQTPLHEFHKLTRDVFGVMLERIEDDMVRTYDSVEISDDGVDWEQAGLVRPSSTWTYLVRDDAFDNQGLRTLFQQPGTSAFGVLLWGPFLLAQGLWILWKQRLTGRSERERPKLGATSSPPPPAPSRTPRSR